MARRRGQSESTTAVDERDDSSAFAPAADEFWSGEAHDTEENAQAFARVVDDEHDEDAAAQATRSYMGTAIADEERAELAAWAEGKACKSCRRALERAHDLEHLKHDDCGRALRAARVLARDG